MQMNDMVLISVDDHITEPGTVFDNQLSGEALATAPKLRAAPNGTNYWEYQGIKHASIGLNAVVGRPPEEFGMEPTSLSQLRTGCYDVHERVKDMNVNGIAASLNFASFPGFDGGTFINAPNKDQALVHLRAYNDWHVDEWAGAYPGRFIPCGLLPLWDINATAAEVRRLADKGCHAVSMNENPTIRGLPSIHNEHWEPLWKAVADTGTTMCLHIGSGNRAPHASSETPIEAWISTMPISIVIGAADWLNLSALHRYPTMRIALSEGSIGWVPYFLERADFSHKQHHAWTHSEAYLNGMKPSDVFKRHFLNCFIEDSFGLKNLEDIGEDNIAYECDYPHSDSLWPYVPENLWPALSRLTDAQIDKVTHGNAMRDFKFNPFAHHRKEDLTVGALRAKATQQAVDISVKSSGGAAPLSDGELRPVTSGDIQNMFRKQAEVA
jgi:predicted TIM-barrel fold metal-dependent hydrolase